MSTIGRHECRRPRARRRRPAASHTASLGHYVHAGILPAQSWVKPHGFYCLRRPSAASGAHPPASCGLPPPVVDHSLGRRPCRPRFYGNANRIDAHRTNPSFPRRRESSRSTLSDRSLDPRLRGDDGGAGRGVPRPVTSSTARALINAGTEAREAGCRPSAWWPRLGGGGRTPPELAQQSRPKAASNSRNREA